MSAPKEMSFADAAYMVLTGADAPLHYDEITQRALDAGHIETTGKTPAATMAAVLSVAIKRKGAAARFVRVRRGVYGLRDAQGEGPAPEAAEGPQRAPGVKVPLFPLYEAVRAALPVWAGRRRGDVTGIRSTLKRHRGNPKANADWSNPAEWIGRLLEGREADTARAVWEETGGLVNPADLRGHWLLASNYHLVEVGPDQLLRLTDGGKDFVEQERGETVRQLDEREGLFKILAIVAELGPGKRAAFIEPWTDYVTRISNVRGDTTAKSYLLYRMNNLRSREFLARSGATWSVTGAGLAYLRGTAWDDDAGGEDEDATLRDLLAAGKARVRDQIRELLHAMDPFAFERLVGTLLEALGYQDVVVTKPAGDKGVDVTARIELGITSVREVVQAKRQKGNVQRTVLDSLRGSLHRWQAVRGTIITTAGFSKGAQAAAFEHGAAPITLINGDKLVDLLIENEIGVRKRRVEVWDLDEEAFAADEDAPDTEP